MPYLTVGQLRKVLAQFDDDSPVMLRILNGQRGLRADVSTVTMDDTERAVVIAGSSF